MQSLAIAVADRGRALGLTLVRMQASRVKRSASHHLIFRDARGRKWHLRLSDHKRQPATGYEKPHFDLVTDGREGAELAFGFVARVSRGEVPWTEPEMTRVRRGQRYWGKR